MSEKPSWYAAILVGGSGTRFWPLSRRSHPKPFLSVIDSKSLVENTLERFQGLLPAKNILLVAGAEQKHILEKTLPEFPPENILYEPEGRDTAAAIGLACIEVQRRNPDAILGTFACDHYVHSNDSFQSTLQAAYTLAGNSEAIVTIGIPALTPETGFGYIHKGKALSLPESNALAFEVQSFQEKPDKVTAENYVSSKEYYFNCSMFISKASSLWTAYGEHAPELATSLSAIKNELPLQISNAKVASLYSKMEKTSFDYAIMEKTALVYVVEARFDWDDLGSWDAWERYHEADAQGNRQQGNVIQVDSEGCTVIAAQDRLIVTSGLKDHIVIQTDDATLILPRDQLGSMKRMIQALRDAGKETFL